MATLDSDQQTLSINGRRVAVGISPGLIPVQPKDGISIGHDELSAAGKYEAPNRLDGVVTNIDVTTR